MLCGFTPPEKDWANFVDYSYLITDVRVRHDFGSAILRTSKETYREAYDVMVKTNRFVKITSVRGIPLRPSLFGQEVPLVSVDDYVVNSFKGYVLDVHLDYKSSDPSLRDDRWRLALEPFTCMVLHRDLDKVCEAFNNGDAHRKGLIATLKMRITVAPVLDAMRDNAISPFFDDFFTKKTQETLLRPFTANLYGYHAVEVEGHVDSALAAAVRQKVAQD